MINNLWNIGKTALQNAQVAVNNASNNIANADTTGYQQTTVSYESNSTITTLGVTVGTGASITSITTEWDSYVESQYLDALAELAAESSSLDYLSTLNQLLNQSDSGLSDVLEEWVDAWNELVTDPDSTSAREDLLGDTESLVYALNSSVSSLESMVDSINDEISSSVDDVNELIDSIASTNQALMTNPDDTDAQSQLAESIRELDALVGIDVVYESDGSATVMTTEGNTLVDGTETHHLTYANAQVSESLMRDSEYDGTIQYSGTSGEEILIEFVTSGTDGAAQFKVSLDGGETWETDEDGNTQLYTADDEDNSVTIEGVTIWFEDSTTEHTEGDRYNIVAKSGLYWESNDGDLVNITPMTDASGDDVSGRVSTGSLAGLFTTRDDTIMETLEDLNDLAESLIWEVNSAHSQGAGLEHHESLTSNYEVDDSTKALSNAGLTYGDKIVAGDVSFYIYDEDDNVVSNGSISIDPSDSLQDIADSINTGALSSYLTATISDGTLTISGVGDYAFEIASDTSNVLAALGLNSYFTGDSADTIAINDTIADNSNYINTAMVNDDGSLSSGNNDVSSILAEITESTVTINGSETTLSSYLATIVSSAGSAYSTASLNATYAETSADYLYDLQASTTEVNIDEELIDMTKYQQAYEAAAQIITVTQEMMDTVLGLL